MIDPSTAWCLVIIAVPLLGAAWLGRSPGLEATRGRALAVATVTCLLAIAAWSDAVGHWSSLAWTLPTEPLADSPLGIFRLDELNRPLIPLVTLLYLVTIFATPRTKARRFPLQGTLASEGLLLAVFTCVQPWVLIGLLGMQAIPVLAEYRSRRRSSRVFAWHFGVALACLVSGQWLAERGYGEGPAPWLAVFLLTVGVLIRGGSVPVHCWMTDLFENVTMGTAILFVTPVTGAYATIRLLLPVAPDWALRAVALVSLTTAVYAACLALVQVEARRFFAYILLSNASLVLVGLETVTPIGLTGALLVWLSASLALSGLGLTLRAIESRFGRLSLSGFHGLHPHMPSVSAFFLITGLASVGFPGTAGFIAIELLVEGAVTLAPWVGIFVVMATSLNGISILRTYFLLFSGPRHTASVSLGARWPEQIAMLVLTALLLLGGIFPQPGIATRYQAARQIIAEHNLSAHGIQDAAHVPSDRSSAAH